ncbi:MBL fold metallo-hydrolase [Caldichromatium japonicum]|uniref:MBL fold metallo-hydrolase n=1 Tax=Caldichromatium japonicum TaxID=2699430 RepID=A0A6G7VDA0_9GAMM|nr:MBL fold metallo-hydrolase [Caldichromatium japonicum]QIK37767.1 MBL fold metallo-hydrolase [Caldichromatium japonicum]
MSQLVQEIAEGIYCIETGLYRPGLAAAYLIRSGEELAFIDTGPAQAISQLLEALNLLGLDAEQVAYVMPTHVHLDHAGAAGHLMAACPRARLVVHPKGAAHLIDPAKLIAGASAVYGEEPFREVFGQPLPIPAERVIAANDGQTFDLAGRHLTFIDTPGHANHHGCFLDEDTRGIFSGDTFGIAYQAFHTTEGPWLFAPTTPVAFDPDAWLASLDKLMGHQPAAMYLTHYGRINRPAEWVDDLCESIAALAQLALREASQPEARREARLKEAVRNHLLAAIRSHGLALAEDEALELLRVDIELNAQGLEVWLKRRAKRAAVY